MKLVATFNTHPKRTEALKSFLAGLGANIALDEPPTFEEFDDEQVPRDRQDEAGPGGGEPGEEAQPEHDDAGSGDASDGDCELGRPAGEDATEEPQQLDSDRRAEGAVLREEGRPVGAAGIAAAGADLDSEAAWPPADSGPREGTGGVAIVAED